MLIDGGCRVVNGEVYAAAFVNGLVGVNPRRDAG
jgi:hypothetical protein